MEIKLKSTIISLSSDRSRFWRTRSSTRDNGLLTRKSELVKENKFGQMVLSMKVGGETIRPMVKEDVSMPMVMSMKVYGLTTRLMDMVYTTISMVINMKETGKETRSTDKEFKLGQMVISTKEIS